MSFFPKTITGIFAASFSVTKVFAFGLGLNYGVSSFNYKEAMPTPQKSTENGTLKGFGISLHERGQRFHLSQRATLVSGDLNYDGTALAPPYTPFQAVHHHTFRTLEADFGYLVGRGFEVYTGLHFREWVRDVGYTETYRWLMVPFGVRLNLLNAGRLGLVLDAAVRLPVFANLYAHFSDGSYDDATVPMGKTLGGRISLPLSVRLGSGNSESALILKPWFQTVRNTAGSSVQLSSHGAPSGSFATEPGSTGQELGVQFTLAVGF